MCVENECEKTFARRSNKFTGPLVLSKAARREIVEIAVDSNNCVHLRQTTALLVSYFYLIILLVIFNTYKLYL